MTEDMVFCSLLCGLNIHRILISNSFMSYKLSCGTDRIWDSGFKDLSRDLTSGDRLFEIVKSVIDDRF